MAWDWAKKLSSNVIMSVGEAVAPLIRSHVESLQYHWKRVDEEYSRLLQAKSAADLDNPSLLADSKLPEFLNAMVEAVVKEEGGARSNAGSGL
jgi:hypothetical protein